MSTLQELTLNTIDNPDLEARKLPWFHSVARSLEREQHRRMMLTPLAEIQLMKTCPFSEWAYYGHDCQHCLRIWGYGYTIAYRTFKQKQWTFGGLSEETIDYLLAEQDGR